MKAMKSIAYLFVALAIINTSCAQSTNEWKVTVKVIDDAGEPVGGAEAWVAYDTPGEGQSLDPFRPNNWAIAGLTDTNGIFAASHRDTRARSLGLHIRKPGYYPVRVVYELGMSYDPLKWNLNPTWVLKKIRNPIPMYAKSVNLGLPVMGEAAGFDLMVGDWVAPNGSGKEAHVLFTGYLDKRSERDFDYELTVSFPNPGDGIQEFSVPQTRFPNDGSALRSAHAAPPDGYQPVWVQRRTRSPGKPEQNNIDPNRNYFFRVRTVLDENGDVKNAYYGKIYGDFMQFRYYLNPTPNDGNVEFDPKQNLLKGLKSTERVDAP
jgi:hypothetical protein